MQALAAVDLRLATLASRLAGADSDTRDALSEVHRIVGSVVAGLRDLLFDLEPDDLAVPWPDAVRDTVDHALEGSSVVARVVVGEESALGPAERTQALRILREAVRNARTHARAMHVAVQVSAREGGAEVQVTDDGSGFDLREALQLRGHRGLQSMQDRAEVSGGSFRVGPAPAGGTEVVFWLPGPAVP